MSQQPPDPAQGPAVPPSPGPPYGYAPPQRPTPGNAVTALVLGIVGVVMCPLTAIPAIIVGRRAVREIDASQGRLDGRGMAQAGFVLGIVGTVIAALGLILVLVVFVFGAVISTSFESSCTRVTDEPGSFSVTCD